MEKQEKTVLIVEDDPVSRKLLRFHLSEYTLLEAKDGVEGFEIFDANRPDVVISDLKMPRMDGLALYKKIRDLSPSTPVIILSGMGTLTDVIEMLRSGVHDYLEKPIQNKEIVQHTVAKAFNILDLEKANREYQEKLELMVAEKTEKLRNELEARSKVEEELRRAQKEWERTFNALPELIAIINNEFRIVKANRAMAEVLGMSQEEVCGMTCYSALHGSEKVPPHCPHKKMLLDQKIQHVEAYEENLGGNFELTLIPYFDESNSKLIGSIHIGRNINEKKAMEEEREKMQVERLHAQKLESVGQLAAGIAHEINTPVQFVSSNNEFLEESFNDLSELISGYEKLFNSSRNTEGEGDILEEINELRDTADWEYLRDEIPSALSQNRDGLQRVASIVRAMKEFSHPGSKEKESRNVNEIIKTTGVVARNEWKYVAELELDLDEDLPPVLCYSDDIGQVFLNIIINAAHAIEDKLGRNPEGQKGKIGIQSTRRNGCVEVRISDTGVGMPEEVMNKIFDPFYTTKKVGRGTGQGLAIAWNIVAEKHKGELKVESEPGLGTTFIVRMPIPES